MLNNKIIYCSDELEGINIKFTRKVVSVLKEYYQKGSSSEQGGMLFGVFRGNTVEVITVSRPSKSDLRSRYKFTLNRTRANKTIYKYYKKGLHYLGDWHSHPEQVPSPSIQDILTIRSTFKESSHQLNFFMMFILSNSDVSKSYLSLTNGNREFVFERLNHK